jgi:predicted aconitase
MGNCTAVLKKGPTTGISPTGRAVIADVSLSTSYATGGDTVPLAALGLPDGVDALDLCAAVTTPGGHAVEYIPGATPATAPKLRVRDVATGVELTSATNNSAQSVRVIAYQLPNP